MNQANTARKIVALRKELGLTQKQVANHLFVSEQAVSKWERGLALPDVALLPKLAQLLGVEMETLLLHNSFLNEKENGSMKKLKFYICPACGNVITATQEAGVSCCGKKLQAVAPQKAEESEKLMVEQVENDYFITTTHEQSKEHHISFVALLTGDTLILKRQYPEWDMLARIPRIGHGMLVWHCTQHGLHYQLI